jgi:hypothetical protein
MARSCDHDFVALSILPGGLIAWQIPKWVDVPNDRCVGLIPSPKYQIRSGRLHGGHAQTLPPGRRGIRYKVPARWSQPLDVPRASTTAGEIYVHPNGLPDGGVGEIQYRSGADVNLIHELPDNAACGVVSPHLLGIEPRQCSDIRKYCPEWIAFVKLGSKHWESSAPEARSRLGTRPYRGPGLCGKDAIRIFT